MADSISRVLFNNGREPPHGTRVEIRRAEIPGYACVRLNLPGAQDWTELGPIEIQDDGKLVIPVSLVFLSHAKEDADFVRSLSRKLLADGVLAWFDEDDLLPGDTWKHTVDRAIAGADRFLFFASMRSTTKVGYVQKELRLALRQQELRPIGQRFIIPVVLDNAEIPEPLSEFHWVRTSETHWYEKLLKAIRS